MASKAPSTIKGFSWGGVLWVSLLSFIQDSMGWEAWVAFEEKHWVTMSPWWWVISAGISLTVILRAALSEMEARKIALLATRSTTD